MNKTLLKELNQLEGGWLRRIGRIPKTRTEATAKLLARSARQSRQMYADQGHRLVTEIILDKLFSYAKLMCGRSCADDPSVGSNRATIHCRHFKHFTGERMAVSEATEAGRTIPTCES